MLIRDAAPLIRGRNGEPLTPRNLQKRIKNSVTTQSGRKRWQDHGVDPDELDYGLDQPWTETMNQLLGPTEEEQPEFPEEEAPEKEPTPPPAPPKKKATPPKQKRAPRPTKEPAERKLPGWLVDVLVAMAPIAEGFSFAKVGTLAYPEMGTLGQGGWAIIGYTIGLIAFVNYARIENQTKADVWATVLALLQFLTHMAAGGWNLKTVTASLLIVAASWAINAAWKRK